MQVYRIAKENYINDLTGIGAKTVGGRWNFKGIAVLYTSSSVSLSMLECLAHFPPAFAPKNMCLATITLPESKIVTIKNDDLPDDWRSVPSPRILKEIGYNWIKDNKSLVLKVPSTIVPQEYNFIINPLHQDFSKLELKSVIELDFDNRVL